MRARMGLMLAGQAFRTVEISLRDKPPAMLALSAKGTVPVLQLCDGRVIDESWDIIEWAFSSDDAEGWWQRAQSPDKLALLRSNDGVFKTQLDRYKYPQRYPASTAASADTARSLAVAELLVPLESMLSRQAYLGGSSPCAIDLAIFPFVRQFAAVEPAWFAGQELPALHAWLASWLRSSLFEACMRKPAEPVTSDVPEPRRTVEESGRKSTISQSWQRR